ncbi:propanediol utilization protein [Candidatus Uhrbacteria bacterium]|jgi:putative phosphotransacetylase|nr:propanediol utilization protein [Candidatus Uhrbacteria bacterium]
MSRPIPVDIIPSHVYLSQDDQLALFGHGYAMTIEGSLTQGGQHFYEESVEVFGKLKRSMKLRVLGPSWEHSFVEITSTESAFLGINAKDALSGDLSQAASCRLVGPAGEVELKKGVIVMRPHLRCSPSDARSFHINNGDEVSIEIIGNSPRRIDNVVVRVHPTFKLQVDLHADHARELWITRPTHARLVS